ALPFTVKRVESPVRPHGVSVHSNARPCMSFTPNALAQRARAPAAVAPGLHASLSWALPYSKVEFAGPLHARSHSVSVQRRLPTEAQRRAASSRETPVRTGWAGSLGQGCTSMRNGPSPTGTPGASSFV